MFLILRGGSYPRSTTAGQDGLMRRPRLGTCSVLVIGRGPAWTTGQDREKTGRGLGPEPRGARGRHSDWAMAGDRPGGPAGRTVRDPLYVGRTTRERQVLLRM
jgi:hypothetical protein